MNDQVEQFLKNEVTTSRFWVCADCGTENDSDAPCCAACCAPRENALPKRPFATPPSPPPGPNILRPAGSLTADSEEPADELNFVVDDESEPAPEPIPWPDPEPVPTPEPPAKQPFPTLPVLAALLPLLQNAALSLMWDQSLFRRAAVLAWLLAGVTMAAGIPLYMRLWRSERGLRRLLPPLCWIALAVVLLVLGLGAAARRLPPAEAEMGMYSDVYPCAGAACRVDAVHRNDLNGSLKASQAHDLTITGKGSDRHDL